MTVSEMKSFARASYLAKQTTVAAPQVSTNRNTGCTHPKGKDIRKQSFNPRHYVELKERDV